MSVNANDVQELYLTEGLHLVFSEDHPVSLFELFSLSWMASAMMEGKPVLCKGFLPGASFWVQTDLAMEESFPDFCKTQWSEIEYDLLDWVEEAEASPCKTILLPFSEAYVARDAVVNFKPAAVTFERHYRGLA